MGVRNKARGVGVQVGRGGYKEDKTTELQMKCPHGDRSFGSRTVSHAGRAYGQGDVENGDGWGGGWRGRDGGGGGKSVRGLVSFFPRQCQPQFTVRRETTVSRAGGRSRKPARTLCFAS